MRSKYSEVHQSAERASDYDRLFSAGYDGTIWTDVEIPLIESILGECGGADATLADLACGSGRIAERAAPLMSRVDGYDVSEEMLEQARKRLTGTKNVRLIQLDLTDVERLPVEYDVITAFRLFLNADDAIRTASVRVAYASLAPGGIFVANIHCVWPSPVAVLYRIDGWLRERRGKARDELRNSLSIAELQRLLTEAGFDRAEVRHYGYVPRLPFLADRIPPPSSVASSDLLVGSGSGEVRSSRCSSRGSPRRADVLARAP